MIELVVVCMQRLDAPLPDDPWYRSLNTNVSCNRATSFVDVCVYNDFCTDGQFWYFIDRDALKKNRSRDTATPARNDFKTGVVFPRAGVPAPHEAILPFNLGGASESVSDFTSTAVYLSFHPTGKCVCMRSKGLA
jgi:hypothetical protein